MVRHTIIVTADERQRKLVGLMEGQLKNGAEETWGSGLSEELSSMKEICEKVYVLPTPISKLDNNQEIKRKLKQKLINGSCDSLVSVKVFAGVVNEEWECFFEDHGICYWDLMKLPEVVDGNAYITAEATLAEVLNKSAYSICGQKILVTGYGCCGKKIADLFARLGAKVIVVARRAEVCDEAKRDGHEAMTFEECYRVVAEGKECVRRGIHLYDVRTVINTVPALVVKEELIRTLPPDACIIDIASKPGGTDFKAAQNYGITAKLSLGLPGIYTTTSSALLLKKAILKYAPLPKNVSEDKLWIFQIII